MKIIHKLNEKTTIEVEADKQKDVFKDLASAGEVFGETTCGSCGGTDLRYIHRNVDDNDFYEVKCQKCFAVLAMGQHKKNGTLFPRRRDDEGKTIGDKGWKKWEKPTT